MHVTQAATAADWPVVLPDQALDYSASAWQPHGRSPDAARGTEMSGIAAAPQFCRNLRKLPEVYISADDKCRKCREARHTSTDGDLRPSPGDPMLSDLVYTQMFIAHAICGCSVPSYVQLRPRSWPVSTKGA